MDLVTCVMLVPYVLVMQWHLNLFQSYQIGDFQSLNNIYPPGIVHFAQAIRSLEREDPEVAQLHAQVRAHFLPPVAINTEPSSWSIIQNHGSDIWKILCCPRYVRYIASGDWLTSPFFLVPSDEKKVGVIFTIRIEYFKVLAWSYADYFNLCKRKGMSEKPLFFCITEVIVLFLLNSICGNHIIPCRKVEILSHILTWLCTIHWQMTLHFKFVYVLGC